MSRRSKAALARVLAVVLFSAALEAICRAGLVKPITLVPPSVMVRELWALLRAGTLGPDLARTATAVGGAFAASVVLGIALGASAHARPALRRAIGPVLASWYSVPSFIFYPLLVALLGLSAAPLIVIGTIAGTPAMMIGTIAGLDRIPRVLLRVARVHRLSRPATFRHVTLPALAPNLFTGVKLAFAYAFISVIAGEFILAGGGLGYSISYAYENFETRRMYALMLLVLLVAAGVNGVLSWWEGRILRRRGL
ncbi:MAG TPA: ABC transporter permease subunit [Acetobacteraceae bacterium]|nr:ABC transporter permease subunit [Acetobacteraceae bacterium]